MTAAVRSAGPTRPRARWGRRASRRVAGARRLPGWLGFGGQVRRSARASVQGGGGRVDRGSATAELAAGMPAVVLLLAAGLTAVGAVTTKLQCVDAARDAALAAARGEPGTAAGEQSAPAAVEVSVTVTGDTVTATVAAPVPALGARLPGLTVRASAVAAVEPGLPDPAR